MRVRPVLAAAVLAVVTAGCGVVPSVGDLGGGDEPETVQEDEGTLVPEALVGLTCDGAEGGSVTVSGVLSNAGKRAARYQVTAYADVADGQPRQGRVAVVGPVPGGGTADFAVEGVPAAGDAPECRVQVLKLPA